MARTPSAEIESTILAAAEELLTTEGPGALSVRRIAELAGVAPMSVYNHFGSKNGVIDALYFGSLEHLGAAMASLSEIEDPVDAVLEGLRRYRRLALEHRAAYQLMFRWWAIPSYEPSPEARAAAQQAFASLNAAVSRALVAGAIKGPSPEEITRQLWAAIHGWVSTEVGGPSFVADEGDDNVEAFLAMILRGLSR
jgi:AcrR family transcriptional regulator